MGQRISRDSVETMADSTGNISLATRQKIVKLKHFAASLRPMQPIIITIDGYSSCGKSTLAKQLAHELGYIFIDSGAMYRAVTLYLLRNNITFSDVANVHHALQHIHLSFHKNNQTGDNEIYLNGDNVSLQIREMDVSQSVSDVAALAEGSRVCRCSTA